MYMEMYASSRLSEYTLRRAHVAILGMITLTSSSWQNAQETYKAHSEDCGIVGKTGDEGYQTHSGLIPRPSTS